MPNYYAQEAIKILRSLEIPVANKMDYMCLTTLIKELLVLPSELDSPDILLTLVENWYINPSDKPSYDAGITFLTEYNLMPG